LVFASLCAITTGAIDMTAHDRARLAAEYGIDPAAIPEPTIIPQGVMSDSTMDPRQRTQNGFRSYALGKRLRTADRRAGITRSKGADPWPID
jgi:hypothetical protein